MRLATHDLGGSGAPLLFVHGNGLHAHTLAVLAAELSDRSCIGIDLRGFGHSEAPTADPFDWQTHGDDLRETVEALDLVGADVFGFSMGGASSVIAQLRHPGTFGRLALYEPIVMPPPWGRESTATESTLRRRFHFDSVDAAIERFASKPPWSTVLPQAVEDYVVWGTKPNPDGEGIVLRCDPRHEAINYQAGISHDTWDHLDSIAVPVLVMGGSAPGAGEVASDVADRIPGAAYRRFEHLTHFGPMQDPAAVAAAIRDFFDTSSS